MQVREQLLSFLCDCVADFNETPEPHYVTKALELLLGIVRTFGGDAFDSPTGLANVCSVLVKVGWQTLNPKP